MTFQEALDYLSGLSPRGWRLGLDRMREFAHRLGLGDALGDPGPGFIHVAGTNGKGSTTAYVQSILHESGYRVGAYFSPYVYDPRERIQLGRELIPEGIFAGLVAMLKPVAEEFDDSEFGGITEFEFKTAMALMFYKRLRCEWVALEVGLGGRLDATNIVSPRCCVITGISLDHTHILGETLPEIAREKAGIIKSGVPVVVGSMPEAAADAIQEAARSLRAPVWRYGREIQVGQDVRDGSIVVSTPAGQHAGLELGIRGVMQGHNMALAVAACDAAGATRTLKGVQRGCALASIPGRFEVRSYEGHLVVLDGAHNAEAATVLAEGLGILMTTGRAPGSIARVGVDSSGPGPDKFCLVTGMMAGHEPRDFFAPLAHWLDRAIVVPIDSPRALDPGIVLRELEGLGVSVSAANSVEEGIDEALSGPDPVLIAGSFYLVGDAGRHLAEKHGIAR